MAREAPCVCVLSAALGLHAVLGLPACDWLRTLRTRTVRDQLHRQLVKTRKAVGRLRSAKGAAAALIALVSLFQGGE